MSIKNTTLAQAKRARDIADVVGGTPEIDYNHPSLNHSFYVSVFTDTKATNFRRGPDATLIALEGIIRTKRMPSKDRLPLLKLAIFGDKRSDKGSLRHDANMISITGVEVDYDAGRITPEQARDTLADADLAGLVYTTPSHTNDAPRWRIICPTSKAILPANRNKLVARLNGLFNGELAGESFTASQSFYFGGVAGQAEPITYLNPGRYINRATNLDPIAIGRGGRDAKAAQDDDRDTDDTRTGRSPDVIADSLWSIPNGGTGPCNERDDWLRVVQGLHHEFDGSEDGLELLMEWSAQHPSHDDKKVRSAYRSCGRYMGKPVTAWHIIALAKANGWRDDDALRAMFDIDDDLPIEDKPNPKATDSRLTFRTPDECADMPTRRYVVKGLVAEGDVAAIIGTPGVGKSLLAPRIGFAVAQGQDLFGHRTRQGKVFYVAAEDESGMRARVTALRADHGPADDFTLVGGVTSLFPDSDDLRELRRAVKAERPSLIVIDTLAIAFPGLIENSAEGMGMVVAAARSLTRWGAAVFLVHHDTKDGANGLPRGHSLLNGALDMSLHLTRDQNGIVLAKPTKNRNGSSESQMAFRIGTRALGIDDDGDEITTAICEDLASEYEPIQKEKWSGAEKAAADILKTIGETDDPTWRQAAVDGRMVSASEDPDNRRRAFTRAKEGLLRKGDVIMEGDRYRLAGAVGRSDFDSDDDGENQVSANDRSKLRGRIHYDDIV